MMDKILIFFTRASLVFILAITFSYKAYAEDIDSLVQQLQVLQEDIKT